MSQGFREAVLWLFIVFLGITSGAGLYELRVMVPQWFGRAGRPSVNSELFRRTDPGRAFWAFVTTGPLTLLTVASFFAAQAVPAPARVWWLGAAGVTLVERLGTFSFFIPTALKLMRPDVPETVAASMAARWIWCNWVRIGLNLLGWLAALEAFALVGGRP
jgi:hypothetical protein